MITTIPTAASSLNSRREHWDANTTVACWLNGHRLIAVNRHAVVNVVRVIEQAERTFAPAFDFTFDGEAACRRDGAPRLTSFGETLAGAYRDGQDEQRRVAAFYQEEHLAAEINLNVRIAWFRAK